jgi:hypothetical protein
VSIRFAPRLLKLCALTTLLAAPYAMAASSTDPVFTAGLLGSYGDYKLEGGSESDKEHMPQAGLFFNFGNKLTAESGFIYQAGVEAKYGKKSDNKLKEGQGDVDLGWRAALDARNFVDVIVGGGYGWTRYEPDSDEYDIEMTARSPFAKAALGYNHKFDQGTMRVELGARRTINSDTYIKVNDLGSDTVNLKDRTNPYAEVSFLMNQNGSLPLTAGVYYTRSEYKLDEDSDVADNTKLKRDEYGVKVGLAF